MPTIEKRLKQFFEDHFPKLQGFYPGLTFTRFKLDFSFFTNHQPPLGQFKNNLAHSISNENWKNWENLILSGTPLGHITGESHFAGLDFWVNQSTLIPRFETEILLELALNEVKKFKSPKRKMKVCDVGTGTGALALALMYHSKTKLEMYALDYYPQALDLAQSNLHKLRFSLDPEHEISFQLTDRLSDFHQKCDLIISNPPYIKYSQKAGVHHQVSNFEPESALFLTDEIYLKWFEGFFSQVKSALAPQGAFIMEGHEDNWDELLGLCDGGEFDPVELKEDLAGNKRFLLLRRKSDPIMENC